MENRPIVKGTGLISTIICLAVQFPVHGASVRDYRNPAQLVADNLLLAVLADESGRVESGWLSKPATIGGVHFGEGRVYFWGNGRVRQGNLAGDTKIGGLALSPSWPAEFHDNGNVRSGALAAPASINGRDYRAGTWICLREDGTVECFLDPANEDKEIGGMSLARGSIIRLHGNGRVAGGVLANGIFVKGVRMAPGNRVSFYDNGEIEYTWMRIINGLSDSETIGTKCGSINSSSEIRFYRGGIVKALYASSETAMFRVGSERASIMIPAGGLAWFYLDGTLKCTETADGMRLFGRAAGGLGEDIPGDASNWMPCRPREDLGRLSVEPDGGVLRVSGAGADLAVESLFRAGEKFRRARLLAFEVMFRSPVEPRPSVKVTIEEAGRIGKPPPKGKEPYCWWLGGDRRGMPDTRERREVWPGIRIANGDAIRRNAWMRMEVELGKMRDGNFARINLPPEELHKVSIVFPGYSEDLDVLIKGVHFE